MKDDSKRSDFPCPGIIKGGSGSTAQSRQSQKISDHFAERLDRQNTSKARAINERNNDYLAAKRRKMTKSIRKPS